MYAGRVTWCARAEYVPRALLKLEKKDGTVGRTDGQTPDGNITLSAKRGERNKQLRVNPDNNAALLTRDALQSAVRAMTNCNVCLSSNLSCSL